MLILSQVHQSGESAAVLIIRTAICQAAELPIWVAAQTGLVCIVFE